VPGYRVSWEGDGEITPLDSVTDDLGLAHARWVMPRYPDVGWNPAPAGPSGTFAIRARVSDLPSAAVVTTARSFTAEQIDAESSVGCGIRAAELWCWGVWGQETRLRAKADLPSTIVPTDVAVTGAAVCILDQLGKPWCGELTPFTGVVPIANAPALRDLSKGTYFFSYTSRFCGLALADRTAWCWSLESDGFSAAARVSPVPLAVAAPGADFWCGLDLAGAVWCKGDNEYGQLGDGTTTSRVTLARVAGLPPSVSLDASSHAACAAESDGTIWCWGLGPHTGVSPLPVKVGVEGIRGTDINVGENAGSVLVNGEVRFWAGSYQLFDLFRVAPYYQLVQIVGNGQSCVRTVTNEVFCSWILVHGGGDTSAYPSELVPLPPVPE
jgi:hypothetical protein